MGSSKTDSLLGAQLGQYEVVNMIGKGGMATVYMGRQIAMNRTVAIKILPRNFTHDDSFMRRFRREGEIVANLEHLHILPVYDYGEFDGMPYIVMRYLEGGSVKERVRQGPLPWHEVIRLSTQVASALDYAHGKGVVHRDVKPNNILLDTHDNAYLSDFGLAKILMEGAGGEYSASGTGSMVGTPAYMAPEMLGGGKPTPRIDIYGLGVSVFEMITGQIPFPADTPIAQLLAHTQRPVPSLLRFNPELPSEVDAVIQKAMAKYPSQRHQTAGEFAAELSRTANASGGWTWTPEALSALPRLRDELAAEITVLAPEPLYTEPLDDAFTPPPPRRMRRIRLDRRWVRPLVFALGILTLLLALRFSPYWESDIRPAGNRVVALIQPPSVRLTATALAAAMQPTPAVAPTRTSPPATNTLPAVLPPTAETPTAPPPTPTPTRTPEPSPTVSPTALPETLTQNTTTMLLVPAGAFTMGSRLGRPDEQPEHEVYLDAYYIDRVEVSIGNYAACVAARACKAPEITRSRTRFSYYGVEAYNNHPVINVQWTEAFSYCRWRGAHLPTEAQWEKAASWGPDVTIARRFPWGTDDRGPTRMNWGGGDTVPVGSYLQGASAYGVLDLAGNVAEWVFDWYLEDYYSMSDYDNPLGPPDGDGKVYRGGSYADFGQELTTSGRSFAGPTDRLETVGFRCAWTPGGDPTQ